MTSNLSSQGYDHQLGIHGIENPGYGRENPPPYEDVQSSAYESTAPLLTDTPLPPYGAAITPYNTPPPSYSPSPNQQYPYNQAQSNGSDHSQLAERDTTPSNSYFHIIVRSIHVRPVSTLTPPNDGLCFSIFVTIFCCFFLGIFAIMMSVQCRQAIQAGNLVEAHKKSRMAVRLSTLAVTFGLGIIIAGIVVYCISGDSSNSHGNAEVQCDPNSLYGTYQKKCD